MPISSPSPRLSATAISSKRRVLSYLRYVPGVRVSLPVDYGVYKLAVRLNHGWPLTSFAFVVFCWTFPFILGNLGKVCYTAKILSHDTNLHSTCCMNQSICFVRNSNQCELTIFDFKQTDDFESVPSNVFLRIYPRIWSNQVGLKSLYSVFPKLFLVHGYCDLIAQLLATPRPMHL